MGMSGRSNALARFTLLAVAGMMLGPVPALAASDSPCGAMPQGTVISVPTPKDAGRLPPDHPVVAWIGAPANEGVGGQPDPWPTDVLARMKLAPGSVVSGVGLSKGSLAGWQAPGVRFLDVGFADVSLAGANLAGACFDHGAVAGSDFSGANLSGTRFEGTDVSGGRFDRANLSGAVLTCAPGIMGEGCGGYDDQHPISLRDADLRGADVAGPVSMLDAVLDGARVERTSLPLTPEVVSGLAKARVAEVRLVPPMLRSGDGEVFTGAGLDRLRQMSNDKVLDLLVDLSGSPSFDCALPGLSVVEKTLCSPGDLAALDRLMAATYRRAMDAAADKTLMKTAQTAFLKTRNACAAAGEDARYTCIAAAYTARLAELGRGFVKTVTAPGTRRFTGGGFIAKPAVANEPLVAKLLRAFGDSPDVAQIESAKGALSLTAEASGANGHSCSFDAPLRFDTVRGLWIGESDGEKMAWIVLPDGLVTASSPEEARYFCGMRASWPGVFFPLP